MTAVVMSVRANGILYQEVAFFMVSGAHSYAFKL